MIDVSEEHLATVRGILGRVVPGCEVRAFGSRVRGVARAYSDLDLAVLMEGPGTLGRIGMLREAFMESDLPFRVDVVDWGRASEGFRAAVGGGYEVVQARG